MVEPYLHRGCERIGHSVGPTCLFTYGVTYCERSETFNLSFVLIQ